MDVGSQKKHNLAAAGDSISTEGEHFIFFLNDVHHAGIPPPSHRGPVPYTCSTLLDWRSFDITSP